MRISPILQRFFSRRERLLEVLTRTGVKVSGWYEHRRETEPTLHELAELEGMLAERRTWLEQLMKLDDDMLTELVKVRGQLQHQERQSACPQGESTG
jgi:hypothetical protein